MPVVSRKRTTNTLGSKVTAWERLMRIHLVLNELCDTLNFTTGQEVITIHAYKTNIISLQSKFKVYMHLMC